MKIETAIKKVVDFLQNNPGSGKEAIGKATKVKGLDLTNVIKRLRKEGTLQEEGEGADLKLSIKKLSAETAAVEEQPEPVVEDGVKATKGRDNTKFSINGEGAYGKGPMCREVVKQYVTAHPKVTIKQLKEVFPDELLHRFGIFQEESKARELSGARDRYFFKEEHQIRLGDKKTVIVVSSQHTAKTVIPFIAVAKKLGFKIK